MVLRTYCLTCQDELFVNDTLDAKDDEHTFHFVLHLPRLFGSR
jgi:hypothetical protein